MHESVMTNTCSMPTNRLPRSESTRATRPLAPCFANPAIIILTRAAGDDTQGGEAKCPEDGVQTFRECLCAGSVSDRAERATHRVPIAGLESVATCVLTRCGRLALSATVLSTTL